MKHQWYALNATGVLHTLAECADFEDAEAEVAAMGLEAVWIVDPVIADQWRAALNGGEE